MRQELFIWSLLDTTTMTDPSSVNDNTMWKVLEPSLTPQSVRLHIITDSWPQLVHTGNEYLDCFNEEWFSSHYF